MVDIIRELLEGGSGGVKKGNPEMCKLDGK